MGWGYNPFTGKLDKVGVTQGAADDRYVNVTGDTMTGDLELENGVKIYVGDNTYLVKNGQVLELWVNNVLHESWEENPIVATGTPIGLLLGLTYTN